MKKQWNRRSGLDSQLVCQFVLSSSFDSGHNAKWRKSTLRVPTQQPMAQFENKPVMPYMQNHMILPCLIARYADLVWSTRYSYRLGSFGEWIYIINDDGNHHGGHQPFLNSRSSVLGTVASWATDPQSGQFRMKPESEFEIWDQAFDGKAIRKAVFFTQYCG